MNATKNSTKVGRYTIKAETDSYGDPCYTVYEGRDEVDSQDTLEEAIEAAELMEADALEDERQERLGDLRYEIAALLDDCEDEALLKKIKALLK